MLPPSPDPEKLSKAESVIEEAISLLLIGSVLTVNKEVTLSPNRKKGTLYLLVLSFAVFKTTPQKKESREEQTEQWFSS